MGTMKKPRKRIQDLTPEEAARYAEELREEVEQADREDAEFFLHSWFLEADDDDLVPYEEVVVIDKNHLN